MRKEIKNILFWGILICLAYSSPSMGFHGTLGKDTTIHGKVLIDGDLVIPQGVILTITPGTIIKFTPGRSKYEVVKDKLCNIVVYGSLMCVGETSANIWIGTPAYKNGKQVAGWGGIMFYGGKTSISHNFRGILVSTKTSIDIKSNTLKENTIGVLLKEAKNTHIIQNKSEENGIGIAIIDSKDINIGKNLFKHNVWGIAVSNSKENYLKISENRFMFNYIGIVGFESSLINCPFHSFPAIIIYTNNQGRCPNWY